MPSVDKQARRLGRRTLQVYKEETDPVAQAASKKMGTTCSEGCSHCCHLLTVITLPEAVAIAEHILTDLSWQAKLPQLMPILYTQMGELADPQLSKKDYFEKKIPCVFLKDSKCSIYAVRPTACRYHYVVSDPKNCAPEAEDPEIARLDLIALEERVWREGAIVSKQVGVPMVAAPLQVALLWALKLLSEGVRGFEQALQDPSLGVMALDYWLKQMTSDTPLARAALEDARQRLEQKAQPSE